MCLDREISANSLFSWLDAVVIWRVEDSKRSSVINTAFSPTISYRWINLVSTFSATCHLIHQNRRRRSSILGSSRGARLLDVEVIPVDILGEVLHQSLDFILVGKGFAQPSRQFQRVRHPATVGPFAVPRRYQPERPQAAVALLVVGFGFVVRPVMVGINRIDQLPGEAFAGAAKGVAGSAASFC